MARVSYEPEPRDLDDPRIDREYDWDGGNIGRVFESWLDEVEAGDVNYWRTTGGHEEIHEMAKAHLEDKIDDITVHPHIANPLIPQYVDHPQIDNAGCFLTELYNQAEQDTFFIDLDVPWEVESPLMHTLGGLEDGGILIVNQDTQYIRSHYKRPANETFVNQGEAVVQVNSKTVINYGTTGFSGDSDQIFFNLGECPSMGDKWSDGVYINYGDLRIGGYKTSGIIIDTVGAEKTHLHEHGEIVLTAEEARAHDELWNYLMNIEDELASAEEPADIDRFVDQFDPNPREAIEAKIRDCVGD